MELEGSSLRLTVDLNRLETSWGYLESLLNTLSLSYLLRKADARGGICKLELGLESKEKGNSQKWCLPPPSFMAGTSI
jgi:hypothetical protein